MKNYHVFITFDLLNTNSLYDNFYKEAEKIGFTRYIPEENVNSKKKVSLPNTTLFSVKYSKDSAILRDTIREQVASIYKMIGAKGNFIVIVSDTWGTKTV
ncbi:MAG: hypothetical protein ACRCY7_00055 [Cetobacterium sp.]|uniref:hypothetical protein n=1 Tax=Cetobacterium sp. TaxID=2071632 RepID=UPI003F3833ED